MRRVVITGMGALTPIGNDVETFWENALEGVSGAAPIQSFDPSQFKTTFACELKDFRPEDHFDRKDLKKYDRYTQIALVATKEAIQNAKIEIEALNLDRVGVIWGSGEGGILTMEEQLAEFNNGDGTPRFNPYFIPKILVNMASGIISIKYGFRGVNYTPVSACASSTTSIIDAFNYIRWNKADMIIAGGSEAGICPSNIGGFNSLKALSTRNEDCTTASRPFDVDRDGFVMGEGAGALVVEELEHAKKRGAKIYGEIVGGGMAADAYHLTGTHPEGAGAILGMRLALEEAGITPDKVDYVNLHATSTPNGDMTEIIALDEIFNKRSSLSVSGTKSMTGHLLGATGAIEAILCAKAIETQMIPPTINVQNIEQQCEGSYNFPLHKGQKAELNYVMSNTFGFGGHIATLLLKKFEE